MGGLAIIPSCGIAQTISPELYASLEYRHIGPDGNRIIAVAGHSKEPDLIYVGAASGGIWKSTDSGLKWDPVFDDQDVSSIGALAVAPSNSDVVWAGTGETNIRSSISIGNGIYKSTDGGVTWEKMGLENTGRIGRIVIHPKDRNIVLVAAMGHCYGPQQDRGVFKTVDGGKTWNRVLFTDENTGASDIAMDPKNPLNLVAGMWPLEIKTWQRKSGGANGGVFVSNDGGETWNKSTKGLPAGNVGKVAVAYAPGSPNRIYALIETDQYAFKGVLWGSEDGGKTWDLISHDQQYHTRPHYYSRLAVAPDDENEIWFLASRMVVSLDGGKTGDIRPDAGYDVHDIWFDPENSDRILIAYDGGIRISQNDGKSWYHPDLPIAQMYHVATDKQVPYFVYGNRQDGRTYRIPSQSIAGPLKKELGGGEVGFAIPDKFDQSIVWSTNEQGVLTKHNLSSGITTNAQVWPVTPVGQSPRDIKYRWVWSHPFILTNHTKNTLYTGSQYVHKTEDGGETWTIISPDLTTNDPQMQVHSGGLTYDNVGVDYGTTLYALAESPINKDVLWAGSNDGLIHVTRNGGKSWEQVSKHISNLPPLGTITSIDASKFSEGKAFVTIDFHQVNNRDPFVYMTKDFGKTWTKIVNGVAVNTFSYAQIIREDPLRKGMLYLGTENAIYFSLDDGAHWHPLKNNLPPAPVRWLDIQEDYGDLVLSTYGRGYWIMDDLSPLRQINDGVLQSNFHFFKPRPTFRLKREVQAESSLGEYFEDPEEGAAINYYLKEGISEDIKIKVLDKDGSVVQELEGTNAPGINRVFWDLRHKSSPEVKLRTLPLGYPEVANLPKGLRFNKEGWRRLIVEGTGPDGPMVAPGQYTLSISIGNDEYTQPLEVLMDPKSKASSEDVLKQVNLALKVRDLATELVTTGNAIEWIRKQLNDLKTTKGVTDGLIKRSKKLDQKLIDIEQNLFILRTTGASENGLRFPQRLFSHIKMLGYYVSQGDASPTASKYEAYTDLLKKWEGHKAAYELLLENELADLNRMLEKKGVDTIKVNAQ
ncbi:glycosyl hydrolase [Ulvibacterium sp.]|uniref:WD40/YVTN/BNR-like repeat-containing protein n=1 Tax=Ulvibacterium sp. TaxID=2665914 RepID=UPI0026384109|nr:glycosyl hydrolase [Ulvibacterium sp.]